MSSARALLEIATETGERDAAQHEDNNPDVAHAERTEAGKRKPMPRGCRYSWVFPLACFSEAEGDDTKDSLDDSPVSPCTEYGKMGGIGSVLRAHEPEVDEVILTDVEKGGRLGELGRRTAAICRSDSLLIHVTRPGRQEWQLNQSQPVLSSLLTYRLLPLP